MRELTPFLSAAVPAVTIVLVVEVLALKDLQTGTLG